VGRVTDLGRESICAAINADLRHVTLIGHNSPTTGNLNLYECFWKIDILSFNMACESLNLDHYKSSNRREKHKGLCG